MTTTSPPAQFSPPVPVRVCRKALPCCSHELSVLPVWVTPLSQIPAAVAWPGYNRYLHLLHHQY